MWRLTHQVHCKFDLGTQSITLRRLSVQDHCRNTEHCIILGTVQYQDAMAYE
jgi:hypothetical protein